MKTLSLRQIGNSQGIILEKTILDLVGVDQKNTVFELRIEDGEIILRPVSTREKKDMIRDAAKKITQTQSSILKKLAK